MSVSRNILALPDGPINQIVRQRLNAALLEVVDGGGELGGTTDALAIHTGDAAGGDLTGNYPNPTILASVLRPFYRHGHRFFQHPESGPVFMGSPNNTQWRLRVDDTDLSLPILYVELATATTASDIVFAAASAGLIVSGRINGNLYRFTLDDTQTDAGILQITKLAAETSVDVADDYWLEPGADFSILGNPITDADGTYRRLWTVFVDDTNTEGVISVELFSRDRI